MKFKCVLFFLFFFNQFNLFAQDFQWAGHINGVEDLTQTVSFIEVDNSGNVYSLGVSHSTEYDIDPTQNGVQMINQISQLPYPEDIYLVKVNENGDFIWGKTLSILKDDEHVLGLKFDSQGNIYVFAYITELYQNQTIIYGYGFINVIKIDPDGNEIYRHKFQHQGGNINDGKLYPNCDFAIDSDDNIYIAGAFQNTVQLDDNPQNDLVSNGNSMYALKLNQNGDIIWTKNLNYQLGSIVSLNIDSNNELTLLFDSLNLVTNTWSLNVLKLDNSDGNQIWLKNYENLIINGATIDANNNITVVGASINDDLVALSQDPNIIPNVEETSFILYLNSNGDYFDLKIFDGDIVFYTVEIDDIGDYHFGGSFINSNIDFDPSSNQYLMSSTGFYNNAYYNDGFYLSLNSNRQFSSAFVVGTPFSFIENCYISTVYTIKVVADAIYLGGVFAGNCDLDPSPTTFYFLESIDFSTINLDGFTLKLGNCNTLMPVGNTNQNFCSSQNPTIANLVPNSSSIKWYDSATATTQLNNSTPLVDGTTYFAARQNGSCPESAQRLAVNVNINPSPAAPATNNQIFCESENATISNLIATGQNIKWYASLTDTMDLPMNTVLQNNTDYYVAQTINGCESSRALLHVTVNSVALPTLNSPQNFCVQQNATLASIIISGQNIKWYDAVVDGNLLPNTTVLAAATTYYASQTVNSCESLRVPVVINVQDTAAPIGTAAQVFCSTQNPTLNDIVVSGTDLKWYNSSSGTNTIPNTTQLVDAMTYYVSQTINGCESVSLFAVTISLINTLNANDYSETLCDDLNDGTEDVNLTDYNSNLISDVTNCTFEYYSSFSGAENQTASNVISNFTDYDLEVGNPTIYVRITSDNGCHQVVQLDLFLVDKPVVAILDTVPLCDQKTVRVDAGSGFDSYSWSTGATSETVTISQAGSYSVTVEKNYGSTVCETTKTFNVVVPEIPAIASIDLQDWTDLDNVITINTTVAGNFEYSFDGINYQASNVFSGLSSGIYTVFVRDIYGCSIVDEEVYLSTYPKFFTPNGDGRNDTWSIKFSYFEPGLLVTIFDRYGKVLKTLNNTTSWDGKYNGNDLPSTDYWFVVVRENGKEFKGHFTLKR